MLRPGDGYRQRTAVENRETMRRGTAKPHDDTVVLPQPYLLNTRTDAGFSVILAREPKTKGRAPAQPATTPGHRAATQSDVTGTGGSGTERRGGCGYN